MAVSRKRTHQPLFRMDSAYRYQTTGMIRNDYLSRRDGRSERCFPSRKIHFLDNPSYDLNGHLRTHGTNLPAARNMYIANLDAKITVFNLNFSSPPFGSWWQLKQDVAVKREHGVGRRPGGWRSRLKSLADFEVWRYSCICRIMVVRPGRG